MAIWRNACRTFDYQYANFEKLPHVNLRCLYVLLTSPEIAPRIHSTPLRFGFWNIGIVSPRDFLLFFFFKIGPKARDPRFAGLPPCTRYTISYISSVSCRSALQYFGIRRSSMKYEYRYEWKHQHSLSKCQIYKGSLIIHWRFFRNRSQCTIHMTSREATLKAKSIRLIQTCMVTG